jgi:hypothetical protein
MFVAWTRGVLNHRNKLTCDFSILVTRDTGAGQYLHDD